MIAHKVDQIFSAVAGNCFFNTKSTAKSCFPSAQIVTCYHSLKEKKKEWKKRKGKKTHLQILQVINCGRLQQGIGVTFTNSFPDLTNLQKPMKRL